MKPFLLFLLILNTTISQAKNYYISSKGTDANTGLTAATAWQTIAKLNASFGTIAAGDSILFKCGETFYGSVIVGKSGTSSLPIVFGSYGTGAKPVITGFTTPSTWTNMGNGIWKTTIAGASNSLRVVTINNNLQRIGRYPNYNTTDGGWLSYESTNYATPSITDDQLNTATFNWTGADAVIKKYSYVTDICPITNHSGGTLSYTNTSGLTGTPGYGYFIQNDIRTLDNFGEWFLNKSTKELSVYFGSNNPSSYVLKVSTVDTLFNCGDGNSRVARSYITLSNLTLEGANYRAFHSFNGSNITIKNCTVNNNFDGIYMWNVPSSLTDSDSITNTLNNAVQVFAQVSSPSVITNNYIKNCGLLEGMGKSGSGNSQGITQDGDNVTIKNNTLDSIGYTAIYFNGSNILVKNNYVSNYCATKDDGGGIYTFGDKAKTNRVIEGNIVINGIGARWGRPENSAMTWAIYADGGSNNINIINNSVSLADGGGYQINSGVNQYASGNTFFNVPIGIITQRFPGDPLNRSLRFSKNIIYPTGTNFTYWNGELNAPSVVDIQTDIRAIGTMDSNYYRNDMQSPFNYSYNPSNGASLVDPSNPNFPGWQSLINGDVHSKAIAKTASYSVNSTLGSNSVSNGVFNSNISNYSYYSPNTNFSMSWDNTSKITGTGSMKVTNATSISSYAIISTPVGSVIAGHTYILKFKSLGTTKGSSIDVSFRQTNSPYASFTNPLQYDFTSASITQHEFLFKMNTTDAATAQITFDQSSGTTYIDDVEFYEVDATIIDKSSVLRFEYNATNADKTITLDAKYVGVDSTVYNGSITLRPYTSAILIKSGIIDVNLRADAGTDISLTFPTNSTVLKGSAVGTVTSYIWTKIAGPDQFIIATPNKPSTAISNLSVGVYTFQLKVINSAGDSAFATVNVSETGLLPVTLIDFTAKNVNDKIALEWQVASEINVSHYSIERSSDGQNFENIGQLSANDLANIQVNYNFADNFPLKGSNYYRLVMIDKDGSFSYSKTVSADVNNVASFTVFNVVLSRSNNNVKINLTTNYQQKMRIVLADVSGRIIYADHVELQKGFNAIDKKIPAINTGVYYAKLFTDQLTVRKTVLGGQ